MPILTLKFSKDPSRILNKYRILPGKTMSIGRSQKNDIVIDNLAVSGHHAKIDQVGEEFLLTDLKSKNGTFVNDENVTAHWLKHGDVIAIGKHIIVFTIAKGEEEPDKKDSAYMDQTMVMDAKQLQAMAAKKDKQPEAEKKAPAPKKTVGVLSYLAGGEGEIELPKKLTKLGKNPSNDIVIGGLMMGQTAATIEKRPEGYNLSYVGGMSKPKVNGEVVKQSVPLKQFDIIELGPVKLQFVLKS